MFNEAERLELVHQFQYEHDVSQLQVDGLRVWPIVMLQLEKLRAENFGARSILDMARLALKGAISYGALAYDKLRDRNHTIPANRPADVLLLTDPKRRVLIRGAFFDRITDPFVDALRKIDYRCSTLEWSLDHEYRVPRYNPSAMIQDEIDAVLLRNLLGWRNLKQELEPLKTRRFKAILTYHRTTYDVFVPDLVRSVRLALSLKDYFLSRLRGTGAFISFYSPYYGNVAFAFNLACRSLGIYTVEIQHGFYGESSLLQNGYRNVRCHYDLLPDAVWGWEDRDRDAARKWGDDDSLLPYVYVGGNLWSNYWKNPEANENRFVLGDASPLPAAAGRRVALLTLPPYFDIPEWLPDLMRSLTRELVWCIRYHHETKRTTRRRYRAAFRPVTGAEYELSNSLPLPVLLRLSDFHVTVNSSCIAEAKEFSRKSIIISEAGQRIFVSYISAGWAYPATTERQFRDAMEEATSGRPDEDRHPVAAGVLSNADKVRDFIGRLKLPGKRVAS